MADILMFLALGIFLTVIGVLWGAFVIALSNGLIKLWEWVFEK